MSDKSSRARRTRAAPLLPGVLLGALSACAVGPDYVRPAAPAVDRYVNGGDPKATVSAGGVSQRFTPGEQVAAGWWQLFHSAQLDQVVREALAQNPGLEAARAALTASEDQVRAGYGIFYPQAQLDTSATREKLSPLTLGGSGAAPPGPFNLFTLGASVSYALDIFGGQRRALEALKAERDVQAATVTATYQTLCANIVNTLIARAAYGAEIDATRELIQMQQEQVRLGKVRADSGTAPYADVLSLESQLATYEASIPVLEQKLAQADDLLATLTGHTPSQWNPPAISLEDITLPQDLPVSLPSDLVRQRPDILAAEGVAHAASARIGVATAAMLPSVTLTGSFARSGNSTGTWLDAPGHTWAGGADLTAPLFQGGTLWYGRKAATATHQQAEALYRQTVLGAYGQVADSLRALDHDAAALAAQDEALAAAQQALHLVQTNYQAGLATYLDVLNADAQYHQAKIADVDAIALRYQDTVALYVALGGGWWNTPGAVSGR